MSRWYLIPLLLLSAATGGAEQKEGFLEFLWGTPFSVLRDKLGLQQQAQHGPVIQYDSNIAALGEADLQDCYLEFTDGKLSGAFLTTRGARNSHQLLRELEERFGKGKEVDLRTYQWLKGGTSITYDEDSAGDAVVYWYGVDWQKENSSPKVLKHAVP